MYLKADECNKFVILNKVDYYNRVNKIIALPKMIHQTKEILNNCLELITSAFKFKLCISNFIVPKMGSGCDRYCLVLTHQYMYILSKWLVLRFKNLPIKPDSFAVEGSLEFINK